MSKTPRAAEGFTLLELLVGLMILVGVLGGVLACLDGGLRVYDRIQAFGSNEVDVHLAGEQLERDLLAILPSASYQMTSETLQFGRAPLGRAPIVRVQYRAPSGGGLLLWEEGAQGAAGKDMQLLDASMRVSFRFAAREHRGSWLTEWDDDTNMPVAVQMLVEGTHAGTGQVSRVMTLPGMQGEPSS